MESGWDSIVAAVCDRRTTTFAERRYNPNVLRVADPRSGARLCEAQRPEKKGSQLTNHIFSGFTAEILASQSANNF